MLDEPIKLSMRLERRVFAVFEAEAIERHLSVQTVIREALARTAAESFHAENASEDGHRPQGLGWRSSVADQG